MKSILVIGLGRFGKHIAMRFAELGNQVLAVDLSEECVSEVMPYISNAQIGDCTHEDVLQALGASNFDICVVAVGSNLGTSLEITYQLKQLGAPYIIARIISERHAKFLLNNGADEIIYPEKQIADRMAIKHSAKHAFEYIEVMPDYSISEVLVPEKWIGQTVEHLAVRTKYGINILAVKSGNIVMEVKPSHTFKKGEHLLVFGEKKNIVRFSHKA